MRLFWHSFGSHSTAKFPNVRRSSTPRIEQLEDRRLLAFNAVGWDLPSLIGQIGPMLDQSGWNTALFPSPDGDHAGANDPIAQLKEWFADFREDDGSLQVEGTRIAAITGKEFQGVVATFTDASARPTAAAYTARIHWGDGATSEGRIHANSNGGFDVVGVHTYTAPHRLPDLLAGLFGPYRPPDPTAGIELPFGDGARYFLVKIEVANEAAHDRDAALSLAKVSAEAPALTVSAQEIQATFGKEFTGVVGTFRAKDAEAKAEDFVASIRWGDGKSSEGVIAARAEGGFEVKGTHTYEWPLDLPGPLAEIADKVDLNSHPFGLDAIPLPLAVVVKSKAGTARAGDFSVAHVAIPPAAIEATGVKIETTEGQEFTGIVAHFTALDETATADGFASSIDWGDGSRSDGTIVANPKGGFDVTGTHTYRLGDVDWFGPDGALWPDPIDPGKDFLHRPGHHFFHIEVAISTSDGKDHATAHSFAHVAPIPPAIELTGEDIRATFGKEFTGIVATFTAKDAAAAADGFLARIEWGDGTSSDGTIAANDAGGFNVSGTHTFVESANLPDPGTGIVPDNGHDGLFHREFALFSLTITVKSKTGDGQASAHALAHVAFPPAAIEAKGLRFEVTQGKEFSGTVATFIARDDAASADDFAASINWGDGTSSDGKIAVDSAGGFSVIGTHTFAEVHILPEPVNFDHAPISFPLPDWHRGYFHVTVTIKETTSGARAVANSTAIVKAVPPVIRAEGVRLRLEADKEFSGPVARFKITDGDDAAEFKAFFHWGDGSDSTGAIQANDDGGFDVVGTHTYDFGGVYHLSINILSPTGDAAAAFSAAFVEGEREPHTDPGDGTPEPHPFPGDKNLPPPPKDTDDSTLLDPHGNRGDDDDGKILDPRGNRDDDGMIPEKPSRPDDKTRPPAVNGEDGDRKSSPLIPSLPIPIKPRPEGRNVPDGTAPGLTPDQRFINQVYRSLLERAPDDGGLAYWSNFLQQPGASRALVVLLIEGSTEYRQNQVQDLYEAYLHRSADSSGLGYFVNQLQIGVTLEQVQAQITSSLEYYQTRGGGTDAGFLQALYEDALNRGADEGGLAWFGHALQNGASRADVADIIFGSDEYDGNAIGSIYEAFLGRKADSGGLAFFQWALGAGARHEDVLAAVVGSDEFFSKV